MGKRLQAFDSGDVFVFPVADGRFVPGQIISREIGCMDSVLCAVFVDLLSSKQAVEDFIPKLESILCIQLTTRDLLDSGKWKVVRPFAAIDVSTVLPIQRLRESGYVGAKIRGSKIVADLAAAYHGFEAWDDYADPNYLDSLLAPGVFRPLGVILKRAK